MRAARVGDAARRSAVLQPCPAAVRGAVPGRDEAAGGIPADGRVRLASGRLRYLLGPAANLLAIGAAFINPLLTPGLFGAAAVYYVFEQTPLGAGGRLSARPDEPGDDRRQRVGVLMGQIRDLQDEYAEDILRLTVENTALKKRARRLADDNRAPQDKLQE
jgi:hypothetical protein